MRDILKNISNPVFDIIKSEASALGMDTYLVGGYVRDLIMKRNNTDIDVVCIGNGIDLAKNTAKAIDKKLTVSIYKRFGTAHFNWKGIDYEFVGARKESYSKDSRKPDVVPGTLEDDQNRRDFTINAMGISLNIDDYGYLLDPFNGVMDINKKILILKIILVSLLSVTALASLPILTSSGHTSFKHALEWNYFIGIVFFYFLTFLFWRRKKTQVHTPEGA